MRTPLLLLAATLIVTTCLQAQVPASNRGAAQIIYQFPKDGDSNIQPGTTLIVHPANFHSSSASSQDLVFEVKGEQSGSHEGKIEISDDGETILFTPTNPFSRGEAVHVLFRIRETETPVSYTFHIDLLPIEQKAYWKNYFEEKCEQECEAFREKNAAPQQETQGMPLDTFPWYFPVSTIDVNSSGSSDGNIFLTPVGSNLTTQFAFLDMVNSAGTPVFWRELAGRSSGTADFKVLPNNNAVFPIAVKGVGGSLGVGTFYEMNSHYVLVDSFKCGNGISADIHDFELLPNGHALLMAYDPVQVGPSIINDNVIQEIDSAKHVVFQWRALDHFAVGDATHEDTTALQIDFAHLNSIQTDTDGNILASFRHLDEVAKIDRKTGNIIWHWGGKHNQFTFVGDTLQFSHQHDARRIANGHITMFDNGNYHSILFEDNPIVAPSSRVVEYDLDVAKHTATTVWQYKSIPFSNFAGNVQRLPNGNTFVGLGNLSSPSAMEITPSNEVVFQLSIPYQAISYRAYKYQWPVSDASVIPTTAHALNINGIYPSPASKSTTVCFSTSSVGVARIELVNVLGQMVISSNQTISSPGSQTFSMELRTLPAGLYYCRISQNGYSAVRPIVIQQ
ncbi:MAG: aryl-sulfate sulfotransferase [Bacteroidota bacterium]|nr:aryl-sulfate sulfotransferase [Bacteroidota bacterium]MDP4230593.1 aryl-sulfate sulfotransferase [Bacteroidota bacterium]MDP4236249.1 aryl-sulfate sulfotransferase [Bacteroidota bacterium]